VVDERVFGEVSFLNEGGREEEVSSRSRAKGTGLLLLQRDSSSRRFHLCSHTLFGSSSHRANLHLLSVKKRKRETKAEGAASWSSNLADLTLSSRSFPSARQIPSSAKVGSS